MTALTRSDLTLSAAVLLCSALLLGGCATQEPEDDSALRQTQQAYQEIAKDETIRQYAPVAAYEARQALEHADEAEDEAARDHYLYLARGRIELAKVQAERRVLDEQTEALAQKREELVLSAAQERVRELEADIAALEARPTDRGYLVTLSDVLFEVDKAELQPGASQKLGQIASFLDQHPEQEVIIEGHTDSQGPESYNRQLSLHRADAVKQALVAQGIDSTRIITEGYGESQPIASNQSAAGRQLNRRVEVIITNPDQKP